MASGLTGAGHSAGERFGHRMTYVGLFEVGDGFGRAGRL